MPFEFLFLLRLEQRLLQLKLAPHLLVFACSVAMRAWALAPVGGTGVGHGQWPVSLAPVALAHGATFPQASPKGRRTIIWVCVLFYSSLISTLYHLSYFPARQHGHSERGYPLLNRKVQTPKQGCARFRTEYYPAYFFSSES